MELKELRYNIMLALYFPILLYAFSTFDLSENAYAVNELQPVVVADETVVLGQPFQARTFLAVAGGQGQQLTAGDSLVALGDSLLQMPTAALLEPGESEKLIAYNGTYRFQQLSGQSVEIPVAGRFQVRRPEIVATSEATQTLYRLCSNPIRIEVPGLEDRVLRLSAGGAGIESRTITLSPSGDQASVDVFLVDGEQGDVFLGKKSFSVIDPPRPEIRVSNAGRELRNGENLPKARAMLEFGLVPDPEFQRRYPRDARYSIARARVYIRKGLTASQEVGTYDLEGGSTLVLTRVLRDAQPGDRVVIRLEGVVRINHGGQAVTVPLSEASRTFGFTLS